MQVRSKEVPRHPRSSPPAFGETWASKRGVEPSLGGCKPAVRSMKGSLPRREFRLCKEPTGSRVSCNQTKATEGVKSLETQPRGTQRRRGRGMVRQPSWEQEMPVSAPAVRPVGCYPTGGLGAANPISRRTAKRASAERESERLKVSEKRGNARGEKEPHLVCGLAGGKRR